MNALLNHIWGVSPSQDRVWAQVTGLAPSRADRRLLMVWQSFIDDSYKLDGYFVLAGYVATAERWAAFAKDWEALLPRHGALANNGKYHFKMSEMALSPERMERVAPFYRVIEEHAQLCVSVSMKISDLHAAKARIFTPGISLDWGFVNNYYMFVFRLLLDIFHHRKNAFEEIIPVSEKVDFIFDKQAERKQILAAWDEFSEPMPQEVKNRLGADPRFEDDQEFLPLQAADLWAWWIRKWSEDGVLIERLESEHLDFGVFKSQKRVPWVSYTFNEEIIARNLKDMLHEQNPGLSIYDARFSWGD